VEHTNKMMDRQNKDENVSQEQIDEFLAKGGTITKCPTGARSEEIDFKGGFYKRRKAKKEEEQKKDK